MMIVLSVHSINPMTSDSIDWIQLIESCDRLYYISELLVHYDWSI